MRGIRTRLCGIEELEVRQLLSVSLSLSGSTLNITGDSAAQRIQIRDAYSGVYTATSVAIDTNRNGSYADAVDIRRTYNGVRRFNLNLGGGNDVVDAALSEPYSGVTKTFYVRGGSGADRFSFASTVSLGLRNSTLNFDVDMGAGADRVALQLDDLAGATVGGKIVSGIGDDAVSVSSDFDVRNSSVNLSVLLGDGNDSYLESHDLENFDVFGATSVWRTVVRGGTGNDSILGDGFGEGSAVVEGTFSNEFFGDDGEDHIELDVDAIALDGGTLRLQASGGAGADDIWIAAGVVGSGGLIDIAGWGGTESDRLQLMFDANNGGHSYALPGGALLDGGNGADVGVASGTGLSQVVNIEAAD